MSEMYFKAAIRAEISELAGSSYHQAYAYFKQVLGPADDLYEDNGVVEYFEYFPEAHEFVPCNSLDDRWGIEKVLQCVPEYEAKPVNVSYYDLQGEAGSISARFRSVDPDNVRLCVYSWYTGVDEPLEF